MIIALKNARAGRIRRHIPTKELAQKLGSRGHLVETRSLEELARAARDTAAASPKLIAVWGGDGTVTATLTALLSAYGERPLPPLCLLPGGTMNVVSRSLGVKGRPEGAFSRLNEAVEGRAPLRTVERTALRLGDQAGFLFGIGLLANFLEALYEGGTGTRHTMKVLSRAAMDAVRGGPLVGRLFQPFRARLTVDGARWEKERWVNISAGGVEGLGLGFAPYIRAAERRGAFHLIAHDLKPVQTLLELPRIQLGRGMKKVSQGVAETVVLETERPTRYSIDGELYEARDRFELRGGLSVRIVVP
jgi:diacylglycerol kinase family enzyme